MGDAAVPAERGAVRLGRLAAAGHPRSLDRYSTGELLVQAAIVSAVVVALRLVWSFAALRSPGGARDCLCRRGEGRPPYAHVGIVAWSGMRGAVALAAALAIPLTVAGGDPFPSRDLVIFLAFATIVATLVLQGITLPLLVRLLGVEDDGRDDEEEVTARLTAADAAVKRVDALADESWTKTRLSSACAACSTSAAGALRPGPTGTATRLTSTALRSTPGSCRRRSTPSARRSSTSATRAGSATRSCGGWSVTSTSRSRGSPVERGGAPKVRGAGRREGSDRSGRQACGPRTKLGRTMKCMRLGWACLDVWRLGFGSCGLRRVGARHQGRPTDGGRGAQGRRARSRRADAEV